jgi:hypothetical protein
MRGGVGVREPREELVSASNLIAVGGSNESPGHTDRCTVYRTWTRLDFGKPNDLESAIGNVPKEINESMEER